MFTFSHHPNIKSLQTRNNFQSQRFVCYHKLKFGAVMTASSPKTATSNAKLWASLCNDSPALISAEIVCPATKQVHAVWSQRDVVTSRKRIYASTYVEGRDKAFVSSPPVEVSDPAYPENFYSPSRKLFLKFTNKHSNQDVSPNPIIIELWRVGSGLQRCWEVDISIHGTVYTDEWFGSVSWSPDEKMVVYVADRPIARPNPSDADDPQEAWKAALEHKFNEYARDQFGEAYINKRSPTLFIADLEGSRSYAACDHTICKEDIFFGEPKWSPNGELIVATRRHLPFVHPDDPYPRKFEPDGLGLRYCYNRYSAIISFQAPKTAKDLERLPLPVEKVSSDTNLDDFCCSSPRFSHDGRQLIYLSYPKTKDAEAKKKVLPHNGTKLLRCAQVVNCQVSKPFTLIGIPQNPEADGFPGLYLHALPQNPWLDASSIIFSNTWGSVNKILSASFCEKDGLLVAQDQEEIQVLNWGKKIYLSNGTDLSTYSLSVLDKQDQVILFSATNPVHPPHLFLVDLSETHEESSFLAQPVSDIPEGAKSFQFDMRACHTLNLTASSDSKSSFKGTAQMFDKSVHDADTRFEVTILLPPKREEKCPLIVFPHGGPHVATLNAYSQGAMALLKLGFAVLYVNYRGSLGLGQKSLETLPGNVGTQEVNEVVQATRWVVQNKEYDIDEKRIGFLGGSHSGFIGAHTSLIPGLYKRTVLRNPVVNIASMVGTTDIPDWCFCEAALPVDNENGVNLATDPDQLRKMFEHSPVSRVKARTDVSQRPGPTLLQVGGSDRRVPPQQSLEWKRIMTQAYGSGSVVIRWYGNSGHAIDEVPNGDDAWVHALDFLCEL